MANFEQQRYVGNFRVLIKTLFIQILNKFLYFFYSTCIRHLISFGNPLLDHSVKLEDELLLMKYGLQREGQDEMDQDMIMAIIKDAHQM